MLASRSCFCSFFHQSSLYLIKIFAKCFYLLVGSTTVLPDIMMMMMMKRTIGQFWTVSFSLRTKVSQTLQCVLCITTNKYLVRVLVVLLHVRFSVVGPIPFLLCLFFSGSSPIYTSNSLILDVGIGRFLI